MNTKFVKLHAWLGCNTITNEMGSVEIHNYIEYCIVYMLYNVHLWTLVYTFYTTYYSLIYYYLHTWNETFGFDIDCANLFMTESGKSTVI